MASGYGVATVQRPRVTQMAEMRVATSKSMRKLADDLEQRHPEMHTHQHVRDAARALDAGLATAAGRHLEAAMHTLTPLSLMRHGIRDDDGHAMAKQDMNRVYRHSLLVKDYTDLHGETQERIGAIYDRKSALQPPATTPTGGGGGVAQGPGAYGEKIMRPGIPAAKAAAQSLGGSVVGMSATQSSGVRIRSSQVMDLAFNPAQPRDFKGRWSQVPGGAAPRKLQFAGGIGGQGHTKAIWDLGFKYAPGGELAIPYATGPAPDMFRTSMQNAARSLAVRDFSGVHRHLDSADYAARHINADAVRDVQAVRESIKGVPDFVSNRANPRPRNPPLPLIYDSGPAWKGAQSPSGNMGTQFSNIDLSARTAMLERTPAPRGAPGGPGLYHVKGLGHSDYLQQIVKALIEKRGMPPGRAYAIARGAIRKWMRGGGKVHPEVRAAAAGAETQELRAQAQAHMHSNITDQVSNVIELFNPYHAPTGQFTTSQGAGQGGGAAKGGNRKQQKAHLLAQARNDRRKAAALTIQLHALQAQLRSTASGTHHRSTTSRTGKSRTSTPRKTGAGATSAKAARAGKTSTRTSTHVSAATLHAQIIALRGQIQALYAAARQATQRAAKL
jgi:hypothetical protein